ncbi:MAG: chromophore lyase CpcT/CpeT [Synechococcales cyanobacterium M58_A2018_015]|nr:chromophore lyase CpcT/CpeT [Synechococcales cyanobacterium M58_A2018_015]
MPSSALVTLAQWLAGEFENTAQSQEQPAWFVHLRLWHRPLPWRVDGNLALFAEQANVLYLDQPYRQRILVLQETASPDQLRVQYFAVPSPEQVRGAGANPALLQALDPAALEYLPGCELLVTCTPDTYTAKPPAGARCCFQYNGETRQVVLGFQAYSSRYLSYDRGVDPQTGQALWGAIMGAYDFQKYRDFATELPLT